MVNVQYIKRQESESNINTVTYISLSGHLSHIKILPTNLGKTVKHRK